MEDNKNIEKEILKLELKAITITTIKENKIFVLKNELGNIKIFEYPTQKSSDWLYCDQFEKVTDNLLLLKCRIYGDRFFNIQNFKISERFFKWKHLTKINVLLLENPKKKKCILLDPESFVSMKWSDLYLFYAKIRRIRLKENTYVI
jgi:hypothetical protein